MKSITMKSGILKLRERRERRWRRGVCLWALVFVGHVYAWVSPREMMNDFYKSPQKPLTLRRRVLRPTFFSLVALLLSSLGVGAVSTLAHAHALLSLLLLHLLAFAL